MGWYCVYLFDTTGEAVYLSLAHGSTDWTGVEFVPRDHDELRGLGAWAREITHDTAAERADIINSISLKSRRSPLGPAYEASTALAIRYGRDTIPDDEVLADDAAFLGRLLGELYRAEDDAPVPFGPAPEVIALLEAADVAAGKARAPRSGQGFRLNQQQRSAIELHAMAVVYNELDARGWTVKDTHKSKPYDFCCTMGDVELFVEVKGTTSTGSTVVLTRGEVEHHRSVWPANALAIVSGITLSGEGKVEASGGTLSFVQPWEILDDELTVVSYTYRVNP